MPIVRTLYLHNFRNYEKAQLELRPGLNVFVGANGQGKTNLLEALHFLSLLRSFRANAAADLKRHRARSFMLRAELAGSAPETIAVEQGDKRRLLAGGRHVARASDFIGRFSCAAFIPEDIELPRGPAGLRRRFLDITLAQLQPAYLPLLQDYTHALKSRHQLLRQEPVNEAHLQAYDQVLVESGAALALWRREFFASFGPRLTAAAAGFYPPGVRLDLRFQPSLAPPGEAAGPEDYRRCFAQALRDNRQRDIFRQQTHAGPHRDDFVLHLDGKDLARFGSEGQCRLAAMALKKTQAELLLARRGAGEVVLLVDDVIGELDARGRTAFFSSLSEAGQVCVACTDLAVLGGIPPAAICRIEQGTVSPGH